MSITTTKMAQIAINKSLCKEFATSNCSRTVYLKNNDEFQICLFNPYNYTIGADVYIDNKFINGRIVLHPGERCWLERYLDVKRKFKFETYEIDGNDEAAVRATSSNGEIQVRFYKENDNTVTLASTLYDSSYDRSFRSLTGACLNSTNDFVANDSCTTSTLLNASASDLANLSLSDTCASLVASDATFGLNTSARTYAKKSISTDAGTCRSSAASYNAMETGRTAKGSYSNQNFNSVNIDFETWAFTTEHLLILPESRKPYTVNDLQKVYCTECGRKLNPKYKYCPYCGAKCE